jgi:RNA polymerase-binding transcription factor
MNAKDLERYKRLLLAKRDELMVEREEGSAPVPASGDMSGDLIDRAVADTEAELQIRLRQADGRVLKAIDAALERMRAGTYGVCESCGQPISKVRLEAVPWARLCRECKERRQSAA